MSDHNEYFDKDILNIYIVYGISEYLNSFCLTANVIITAGLTKSGFGTWDIALKIKRFMKVVQ